ncbi:ABC transporter substrate-binding protein [Mahella australiensis]|uniref:Extracellular solute-binding protein family 1 n=1 Tax=Mahella australiensis (strain DSM 15567 / CIP 107919 / 50-1 BON) TaxID=697281 RepID=F4A251_MAHA5|nr:ABC transporter substrate-binding protein [Mahella australiensis]AEE97190.1 extracellular solute-binding protein family 1 [Mahella australiensis 50-1 BON]
MVKKILVFMLCVSMLIGLLAGCGSSGTSSDDKADDVNAGSSTGTDNNKEPVTITFWAPNEQNEQFYKEAVAEFEKQNPNIKVETTMLPSINTEIDTKLNAAKLSGTYPDVFVAYLLFIGTRGSKGEFAPLDDYVSKWADKDDILDSAYNSGKYEGKLLGLGFFPAPMLMVYRKDYFEEAGLDPNKPPTNWNELKEYAIKLTKKDASGKLVRAGWDIPIQSGTFLQTMVRQNGGLYIDEEKQYPALDDPKAIEALKFAVDMYNTIGGFPYSYNKLEEVPFIQGKSAISAMNITWLNNLFKEKPDLRGKIDIVPPLVGYSGDKKSAFNGYRYYTIGNDSKHKDEAWKLIEFMMGKEWLWKNYKEYFVPVVRKSLQNDFVSDLNNQQLNGKALLEYVEYGHGEAITPWTSIVNRYAEQAYQEAISNNKTPEQALKDAQKAAVDDLRKNGLIK